VWPVHPNPSQTPPPNPKPNCKLANAPSTKLPVPDAAGTARTSFSNVTMLVYDDNDIVSNTLRGKLRNWEASVRWAFAVLLGGGCVCGS